MSKPCFAFLVFVAVGCVNPPGEVTVTNHYTGACGIDVRFDEESNMYLPIPTGTDVAHEFSAGVFYVGLRADGMMCGNQLCMFKDSQNFNLGGCGGYTAEGFDMIVDVTEETIACGGSMPPAVRPVAACRPAP